MHSATRFLSHRTPVPVPILARRQRISSYSSRPVPSQINQHPAQPHRMSSSSSQFGELKIENTNIKSAAGVELSSQQKTLVGSVLDLFAGRPSLAKLQLWQDEGEFIDPLTIAKGRKQFEPQWYGLQTAFSEIERLHHEVTSSGNPIEMDLKTRYVVKGIGKEQIINSKIKIWVEGDKITKVHDEWDGKLPSSGIAQVSEKYMPLLSPLWWYKYGEGWAFRLWSFTWSTLVWRAFQRLNANSVPYIVSVPKNAEEDAKRGNQ